MSKRFLFLITLSTGCAYISDKHEAWRLDPDDDGVGLEEDCDNDDATIGAAQEWYVDQDEDGFGDDADFTVQCEAPAGHVAEAGDCDDTDPTISPVAEEACDALDNNCNGDVDEGLDIQSLFADEDGDGFGDPDVMVEACGDLPGKVGNSTDCDDTNPYFHAQGPVEIPYNGIDDNCDDTDGDGDADRDGHWAIDYAEQAAVMGVPPVPVPEDFAEDCDDRDPEIYPGAEDTWYDGIDSDCGGEDDCDIDRDGFEASEGVCTPDMPDCDDHAPEIYPGAIERCATAGVDDNCDGDIMGVGAPDCLVFYQDLDLDSYGIDDSVCQCEGAFPHSALISGDCDDADAFAYPDAFETPLYDGRDRDCGGDDDFDMDGDGFVRDVDVGKVTAGVEGSGLLPGGDCADFDAGRHPGVPEDCGTLFDDDCDGSVNAEDAPSCHLIYPDADGDKYGDTAGVECWCEVLASLPIAVGGDCVDSDAAYYPGAEDAWYDGEDTDCAGDDDFDADADGHSRAEDGEASLTSWVIDGSFEFVEGSLDTRLSTGDCSDTDPTINPDATEVCDGVDNDCNDLVDDDPETTVSLYADADGDGYGDPDDSIEGCTVTGRVTDSSDCDDTDLLIYPGAEEFCDATDQDCDGDLADGFSDVDGDGDPDCIDPVMLTDLPHTAFEGPPGSAAGRSVLVGAGGTLYIGAPSADAVYVLEDFSEGPIDLSLDAVEVFYGGVGGFGTSLAEIGLDGGLALLVGAPGLNTVVRIPDPHLGGDIDLMFGVRLSYLSEPWDDALNACGDELTVGTRGDDPPVFVGCTQNTNGGYVLSTSEFGDEGRFLDLGGRGIGISIAVNERFGWSMDTADFNGDGVDDVVIGSPRDDLGCVGSNCGSAYVYMGPFDAPMSYLDADAIMAGAREDAALGDHVRAGPDLDGDGAPDLLIATDQGWSETVSPGDGAVLLVSSAALSYSMIETDAFSKLVGDTTWSRFGYAMETVGDVDGDGSVDMLVSAYETSTTGSNAGAVYGVLGPFEAGVRVVPDEATGVHGSEDDGLGFRMTVGDVGADGAVDVVISGHGNDRLWMIAPEDLFF
jgi:hypothetical protein